MEHAPLRPVPGRPQTPVDQAAATAAVRAALPDLDDASARALALVGIGGGTRADAALRLQLNEAELAERLAGARKALRRSVMPLAGSGWCERAERLISDRLDQVLDPTGAARLDVHLRNCPRCALHERRLVQATDALLMGMPAATPSAVTTAPAAPEPEGVGQPAGAAVLEAEPRTEPGPAAEPDLERVAAAPKPRVTPERIRAGGWYALLVVAVLLTLAALALTVAGVLGAQM